MSENFENEEPKKGQNSWQDASSRRKNRDFESGRGERRWNSDDARGGSRGGRRWEDRGDRQGGRFDGERSNWREGRDDRGGRRQWQDRDDRGGRGGFDRGDRRDGRRDSRPPQYARELDPYLPEEITAEQLDRESRRHLLSLNKENADRVARHLVMAGALIDDNAELAYEHAKAAYRHAARIDIVREALGLTSYATERYGEALRELRTYRRMSDDYTHAAIEADSDRGRGKPDRAIAFFEEIDVTKLPPAAQVELALVISGAYADLDDSERGLELVNTLKVEQFDEVMRARVEIVRAERLAELGREDEANALREQWEPILIEDESIEVVEEDVVELDGDEDLDENMEDDVENSESYDDDEDYFDGDDDQDSEYDNDEENIAEDSYLDDDDDRDEDDDENIDNVDPVDPEHEEPHAH